ncbi:NAD(P)-dependent oxidoreductase [Roseovarius sp. MMSF_3281]|uniref:NAD-dependent epimerase/dehydratase family protein n=1 Tax=Roseovarius sp. MMSF_3281 TaxID=3046694 RepID=UPI00273E2F74|nr:NAD-dependent epimerase/dehydratase family protein [Roseovarius sp. MMSF_3281]
MTRRQDIEGPLILGATGKVGQALARLWPKAAGAGLWQYRPGTSDDVINGFPGPSVAWDILSAPPPALPRGLSGAIVLAGVTGVDERALARNTDLALAGVKAARNAGIARVLVASSQAVYGNERATVEETTPCNPTTPYGKAKLAMERALAGVPGVTCLRLGNVAGADSLFGAAARGPVTLDRFADGSSPQRSYIGPETLAHVVQRLLDPALPLPPVLNVANPGLVAMDEILAAAGLEHVTRPAPATALPKLQLDVTRLCELVPLPGAEARGLVAEARRGGWRA